MSLVLGHRGYSAAHLENSMEAFKAALAAGMDGFELDVQTTLDGVCVVMHDQTTGRTGQADGRVRELIYEDLPLLKNGERAPRLEDVLELEALLINVELKGSGVWKPALQAVSRAGAMTKVLFSSFHHSEIWQLRAASPQARCGLLWTVRQALQLTARQLSQLPEDLWLHPHLLAVKARPQLWRDHADRLVVWGMKHPRKAKLPGFEPAVVIADSP
jgi:glycerophosphoryl diester phosphodiesterase